MAQAGEVLSDRFDALVVIASRDAAPDQAAAIAALADGRTQYTDATGLPALRQRIAAWYGQRYGVEIDPRRIVVTAGASAALQLICLALFEPGDEVLMPDPSYPCNRHFVAAAGATAVLCPRSNLHITGRLPPARGLLARGVPLALGTDSLASAPDLDLLAEAATLHKALPDVDPTVWLRALTAGGAALLGPAAGDDLFGRGTLAQPLVDLGIQRAGGAGDDVVHGAEAFKGVLAVEHTTVVDLS
jgi:hypothetical protein